MDVQTPMNYYTQASAVYKVRGKYKSITVSDLLPISDGTSHFNYLLPSFMIMKYSVNFFCKCMTNISISPCNEISYKTKHNDRQFNCHAALICCCYTTVINCIHCLINLQALCVLCIGQAFRYSPENAFCIFNQQIYFII